MNFSVAGTVVVVVAAFVVVIAGFAVDTDDDVFEFDAVEVAVDTAVVIEVGNVIFDVVVVVDSVVEVVTAFVVDIVDVIFDVGVSTPLVVV